jgi:hypothetical protein
MQPMRADRRLFALIAIFAIAWGALWPLVSAARPKSPEIPSFICTQAGFQISHESPAAPDDAHAKFHCPLCIASVDGTLPASQPSPSWVLSAAAPRITPFVTSVHPRIAARPPPSRAPPALS